MSSKITTKKYIVYIEGGQIYKADSNYLRPLTEDQIEFLKANKWGTLSAKKKLDWLIENNFENIEQFQDTGISIKEARKKMGFAELTQAEEVLGCERCSYTFVEKITSVTDLDTYIFACRFCLNFVEKKYEPKE